MSASSHQAELSSVRSQLEELRARVEKIALTYQGTPDSAVAAELFEADRALTTAGRVIDRALTALSDLARSSSGPFLSVRLVALHRATAAGGQRRPADPRAGGVARRDQSRAEGGACSAPPSVPLGAADPRGWLLRGKPLGSPRTS